MTRTTIRCSSLPLFMTCGNAILNPDNLIPVEQENEAAEAGTIVHAMTEQYALTGTYDLGRVKQRVKPEDYDRAGKLMRNFATVWDSIKKYMPNPKVEVALGVTLGANLELTGHIDLLQTNNTDAYLLDYKTGRVHENHFHQMAGYAYMVWVNAGQPQKYTVYASIVYLEDQTVTPYAFTPKDLLDWAGEVEAQWAKSSYTVGRKCAGCKLQGACPAYRAFAQGSAQVFADNFQVGPDAWASLKPEEAGEIMDRLYVVEKAADRVKLTLRNHVRSKGPVDVGDGKEYVVVEESNEFLDPVKARKVLTKYLPLPLINRLSRINLDETLTAVAARTSKGNRMKARDTLYAAFAKAGAIVKSHSSRMWRRPKQEKQLES